MLVLDRKDHQTIRVGESTITVWRKGNKIKVGIDAPKSVKIARGELERK